MGSWAERTRGKVAAGRPREVADCGMGWAKLQLAGKVAAGRPGEMAAGGAVSFPFACR